MNMGMGFMQSQAPTGTTYAAETTAYLAAMSGESYTAGDIAAIDAFIVSVNANGIWAKLDQLYLLCAKSSTEADSIVNLIYPSYAANGTPSADPRRAITKLTNGGTELTWTSGVGYVTTSGADKLTGNYVPDGTYQFKDENSHVMVYCANDVDANSNGRAIGGASATIVYQIIPRVATTDVAQCRFGKATTFSSGANTSTKGIYIANRSPSDTNKAILWKDGTDIANQTSSDQTLPSKPLTLFGYNDSTAGNYAGIIAAHSVGGGLTAAQVGQYNTALATLLTALGAR